MTLLITLTTWGQVANWKYYIPIFTRFFDFLFFPICICIYFAKFVIMAANSASYAHYLLCLRLLIVGNLIRLFLISIRSTRYVLFYVLFIFHFHFFFCSFFPIDTVNAYLPIVSFLLLCIRLLKKNLGRVLTSGRRFKMQTPKSSPTSCLSYVS